LVYDLRDNCPQNRIIDAVENFSFVGGQIISGSAIQRADPPGDRRSVRTYFIHCGDGPNNSFNTFARGTVAVTAGYHLVPPADIDVFGKDRIIHNLALSIAFDQTTDLTQPGDLTIEIANVD